MYVFLSAEVIENSRKKGVSTISISKWVGKRKVTNVSCEIVLWSCVLPSGKQKRDFFLELTSVLKEQMMPQEF